MSIVACPSIITDYITSFVTNIPSAIALKMFKLITFYTIKVQIRDTLILKHYLDILHFLLLL